MLLQILVSYEYLYECSYKYLFGCNTRVQVWCRFVKREVTVRQKSGALSRESYGGVAGRDMSDHLHMMLGVGSQGAEWHICLQSLPAEKGSSYYTRADA